VSMRICITCRVREVELVTGWKCNLCIREVYLRDRLRRRLSAITPRVVGLVRARDGEICRYCGCQTHFDREHNRRSNELDHVVPVRAGGTGEAANVVVSCLDCNRIKAGRQFILTRVLVWYFDNESDPSIRQIYQSRGLCA
jgi:hypothetical protein